MRTGTLTSPNEIAPLQIALGMWRQRWNDRFGFGANALHTRCGSFRSVLGMSDRPETRRQRCDARGAPRRLLEELKLPQQAGDKRFASLVQLLETGKGERLVRFAYATDGVVRRGPVTLRVKDLERLRAALAKHPGLEEALRL